jgi:hypothetical protein
MARRVLSTSATAPLLTSSLGNLPLVVIERTRKTNETWHTQQIQLSQLSSIGKLIEAEGSGHAIHIERPNLVATTIQHLATEPKTHH